jgi:alkylhydroperoxidase family enzyme
VSDADFAAAREEFTEEELANLSLAIVMINGWNRLNVGF